LSLTNLAVGAIILIVIKASFPVFTGLFQIPMYPSDGAFA